MKTCNKCNTEKTLDKFNLKKRSSQGVASICKICHNEGLKISRQKRISRLGGALNTQLKYKKCSICKERKKCNMFNKKNDVINGLTSQCKQCISVTKKLFYKKNKDKILTTTSEYYRQNKDKVLLNVKKYRNEHKESIVQKKKEKIKKDPFSMFKHRISSLIKSSFCKSKYSKKSTTYLIVGCEFDFLQKYLEQTFLKNYKRNIDAIDVLHIDHIIPICSAQTEREFLKLNHYTNLQYLLAQDNLKKGKRLDFIINKE
jgi:tRNA-binding EMAP/Myf-like protein